MLEVARDQGLPVIWYCEGGGGRPGDVDVMPMVGGSLTCSSFYGLARLSGQVPRIGIGSYSSNLFIVTLYL